MMMAYAKGARTFERHIDIEYGGVPVSPYNSLPHQCDVWFKAWHKAQEMCGGSGRRSAFHRRGATQYPRRSGSRRLREAFCRDWGFHTTCK